MGNILAYAPKASDEKENEVDKKGEAVDIPVDFDFSSWDKHNKEQLTNFIKSMATKNLNLPEDFLLKMQNVELESTTLIPMSLELYKKMFALFGEYKSVQQTQQK